MSELFTTNFEKYNDTTLYDQLHEPYKPELPILLAHIKKSRFDFRACVRYR